MFDRSILPVPDKKVIFKLPEIQFLKLENGIEIHFVKKENLPIIYTSLLSLSGSKFETNNLKGLAYLTSLLIDEGAGEFDALQLSNEIERLGSVFNVYIDQDTIGFSLLSLKENFQQSVRILGKVLREPSFNQNDFDREKKKVTDQILQMHDEAAYIASTAFERIIFRNTYYELPELGFSDTVQNITNDNVRNFYLENFSPSSTKLFIAGNIEKNELLDILNKEFGNWNQGDKKQLKFNYPTRCNTSFYFVDRIDSAQSEIRIGHIAKTRKSPDFYAARIMNTILGGQFSSRINLNLREDKGYTYGANSAFSYYQDAGLFEVHTAVNIDKTASSVKEIFKEINSIREMISNEEIEFAKSYLIKQFPSRFETYSQIAKNIESLIVHSLPVEELVNYEQKLFSTSPDEVRSSALQNIFPEESVVVLVGEKKKIINQFSNEFGIIPIELDIEGNLSD